MEEPLRSAKCAHLIATPTRPPRYPVVGEVSDAARIGDGDHLIGAVIGVSRNPALGIGHGRQKTRDKKTRDRHHVKLVFSDPE